MMKDAIFKSHWERAQSHVVLDVDTAQRLLSPYSREPITNIQLLSDGCANTNYKISFQSDIVAPVVLRLYAREKSALMREITLYRMLAEKLPVPKPLYEDTSCTVFKHPYAIVTWIEGTLMRNVILSGDEKAIHDCAFEAGLYLNHLRQMTFKQSGFFQDDLTITPFHESEKYQPFILTLLQNAIVKESLGDSLHHPVLAWIEQHLNLFPDERNANLVHGDFDPANILVKQINGQWKITAILDWEFAFAGSYGFDMGTFLRYAHKLPACYEQGFIDGVEADGFKLSLNWKTQVKLMDLLFLLQLLHDNPIKSRPKLNHDVLALITHTIKTYHHN